MIGNKLTFGSVTLNSFNAVKRGTIEKAEYDSLSIELISLAKTLLPDEYLTYKHTWKSITVDYRLIVNYHDIRRLENELDDIIGSLHRQKKAELNINGNTCNAFLLKANKSVLNNSGYIELEFINFDGLFFSEEKTVNFGRVFNNTGKKETSRAKLEITPTSNIVKVSKNGSNIIVQNAPLNAKLVIDLENKTVISGGVHQALDLKSDFFVIDYGNNTISITGGTGVIKYREVKAL